MTANRGDVIVLPQQTAPNSLGFRSLCAGDSPFALFGKQFEIQLNGLILMLEHMNLMLAAATDAASASQKRCLSKQGRLNRERIKPCHVLRGIDPLDIKIIGLGNHGARIVSLRFRVQ